MTVGEIIKARRKQLGINADALAEAIGVSRATMFRYENGDIEKVPGDILTKIAKALHTTPHYLMGWMDSAESVLPDNIVPIPQMNSVPLVGAIACGDPILAEENIEDYVEMPEHVRADFALRCKGDSMIGARIHDGDIVYIKQDAYVDNGDIAAVLIGEEATLKRVYRNENSIVFQLENPAYAPLVFSGQEMENIRILGKAVAFTSVIK